MESKKWLEIRAEYQTTIFDLKKMIAPHQITSDLSNPFVSLDHTKEFLRNQRIRSYLNNCREAHKTLGLRKGEKVEEYWLERLTKTEREVFIRFYEQKLDATEIAKELGIKTNQVKAFFNSSMKKVLKQIRQFQREEL